MWRTIRLCSDCRQIRLSVLLFASNQIRFMCPHITNLFVWVAVVTTVTQLSNVEAWEMDIHHLALQTLALLSRCCYLCSPPYRSASSSMDSAQSLWCTSVTLDFTSSLWVTQKTLWNQIWAARAPDRDASVEIQSESHFKAPPIVAWIRSAKIAFHVVCCCPDYLKSIWTQSGHAKKQIWAGSLNKAYVTGVLLLSCLKKCNRSVSVSQYEWKYFLDYHYKEIEKSDFFQLSVMLS